MEIQIDLLSRNSRRKQKIIHGSINENLENRLIRIENVSNKEFLLLNKFINLGKIGKLLLTGLPINIDLSNTGLYSITKPHNYICDFFSLADVKQKNNCINPWNIERLKEKWIENVDVVYYGIAGTTSANRSLKKRLTDLLKHGNGKTTDRGPHKGGEIFWQLKEYENFELWIKPMANPRRVEKELLKKFFEINGKLPFANEIF